MLKKNIEKSIIILAGGTGKRFGANIPKQFLLIQNKPILIHTIERFFRHAPDSEIIVVLPKNQKKYWKNLCKQQSFTIKHKIVEGGKERFFSVKNGLKAVSETDFTAIHDSVRPLVSIDVIKRGFELAQTKNTAVPVIDVKNSYRIAEKNKNSHFDRTKLKIVQTPQIFKTSIVKNAYNQEYCKTFTDDASVVEKFGYQIYLYEGNEENIKITTQTDLKIAEVLFNQ